jgi:hypothetical protein
MSQSRRLPSHSPQEKKLYKCQPLSPHLPKTAQTTVNTTRNLCFTFAHFRRTTNKQHGKTPGSPAKAQRKQKKLQHTALPAPRFRHYPPARHHCMLTLSTREGVASEEQVCYPQSVRRVRRRESCDLPAQSINYHARRLASRQRVMKVLRRGGFTRDGPVLFRRPLQTLAYTLLLGVVVSLCVCVVQAQPAPWEPGACLPSRVVKCGVCRARCSNRSMDCTTCLTAGLECGVCEMGVSTFTGRGERRVISPGVARVIHAAACSVRVL